MCSSFSDRRAGVATSPSCSERATATSTTPSPSAASSAEEGEPRDWAEMRRWRKARRAELIAARVAAGPRRRAGWDKVITAQLLDEVPNLEWLVVGIYWPFKGEYDVRAVARQLHARGTRLALPVVVEKNRPLEFRAWTPEAKLVPGIWNIPVPADGEPIEPEALLVPLVGFDGHRFRLGYGGGYYDRTLASLRRKPVTIGIGFELAELPTIHPQPHDIAMDTIVTEARFE
jgi:5-formyltetrahydrofolate cyclo-ligase